MRYNGNGRRIWRSNAHASIFDTTLENKFKTFNLFTISYRICYNILNLRIEELWSVQCSIFLLISNRTNIVTRIVSPSSPLGDPIDKHGINVSIGLNEHCLEWMYVCPKVASLPKDIPVVRSVTVFGVLFIAVEGRHQGIDFVTGFLDDSRGFYFSIYRGLPVVEALVDGLGV